MFSLWICCYIFIALQFRHASELQDKVLYCEKFLYKRRSSFIVHFFKMRVYICFILFALLLIYSKNVIDAKHNFCAADNPMFTAFNHGVDRLENAFFSVSLL